MSHRVWWQVVINFFVVYTFEWATAHTCFFLPIDYFELRWQIIILLLLELLLNNLILVVMKNLTHCGWRLFLMGKIFACCQALHANYVVILVFLRIVHLFMVPGDHRTLTKLKLLCNRGCEIFFCLGVWWRVETRDKFLTLFYRISGVVFPSWKKILSHADWIKFQLTALVHHFRLEYWTVRLLLKTVADRNLRLFEILIVLEKGWAGVHILLVTSLLFLNPSRLVMIVDGQRLCDSYRWRVDLCKGFVHNLRHVPTFYRLTLVLDWERRMWCSSCPTKEVFQTFSGFCRSADRHISTCLGIILHFYIIELCIRRGYCHPVLAIWI